MGLVNLNKITLFLGFISLLHAAYSAVQHRTYLRITEQEFHALPIDIVFQAVLSLVVLIFSILQIVGNFKEIQAQNQQKTWETLANFPSFYIFNHRGKALYGGHTSNK